MHARLSVRPSFYVFLSVFLSVSVSMSVSVGPSICLSVRLSVRKQTCGCYVRVNRSYLGV